MARSSVIHRSRPCPDLLPPSAVGVEALCCWRGGGRTSHQRADAELILPAICRRASRRHVIGRRADAALRKADQGAPSPRPTTPLHSWRPHSASGAQDLLGASDKVAAPPTVGPSELADPLLLPIQLPQPHPPVLGSESSGGADEAAAAAERCDAAARRMQSTHRAALLHRRVACELRICRLRAARGPAPASAPSSSALDGPAATSAATAEAGTSTLAARTTDAESSAPAAEEATAACVRMIERLDVELALAAEREAP